MSGSNTVAILTLTVHRPSDIRSLLQSAVRSVLRTRVPFSVNYWAPNTNMTVDAISKGALRQITDAGHCPSLYPEGPVVVVRTMLS